MKMISFEDFLLRPSTIVDPFNRFVAKIDPFLTMVEFCQVIGPKALAVVSSDTENKTEGVKINEMAIWLMSSDTVPGTIIVLENNQMGIYAAAYYFNLYDMRARAFQRNLCIAYLSSEKPTKEVLNIFSSSMKKLISPMLICNRRLFIRHVTDIVKFSDSIDETTLQSYYSLNEDAPKIPNLKKYNVVFEQTRLLKNRFLTKKFQDYYFNDDICCGHNTENMLEAEDIICSFRVPSVPLSPVETLMPCAYSLIIPKMREVLEICIKTKLENNETSSRGALFCAQRSIAHMNGSGRSNSGMGILEDCGKIKGEETLKAITGHLGDVLFPIICGDDMVVCGNEQRKSTVEDMLQKLSLVSPQPSAKLNKAVIEIEPKTIGSGLGGLQCAKSETGKLARWRNVLDMNRCVLKTFNYDGTLLNQLNKKRKFPSDRSLIMFIVAQLTNFCTIAYIFRYLAKFPEKLENFEPNLSEDDRRMIISLLCGIDFEKFNGLKGSPSKNRDGPKGFRTINL